MEYCQTLLGGRSGQGQVRSGGSDTRYGGAAGQKWRNEMAQEARVTQVLNDLGYSIMETLGSGTYAKVKRVYYQAGEDSDDSDYFACKMIDRRKVPADFTNKFLGRELAISKHMNHANIIKCHMIAEIGPTVCIVMQMAEGGDLLEYLTKNGALGDTRSKQVFRQLSDAVLYMHSLGVAHRDLKCENILFDNMLDRNILIADFGFGRPVYNEQGSVVQCTTFCGSCAYAPPEVLQNVPYDARLYDVWSMGVILYVVVTGTMLYDDSDPGTMLKSQLRTRITYPSKVSDKVDPRCKDLISKLLQIDVDRRLRSQDIPRCAWLQQR